MHFSALSSHYFTIPKLCDQMFVLKSNIYVNLILLHTQPAREANYFCK